MGGFGNRRWFASHWFRAGFIGLVVLAAVLVAAGLSTAQRGDDSSRAVTPTATAAPEDEDKPRRPRDSFVEDLPGGTTDGGDEMADGSSNAADGSAQGSGGNAASAVILSPTPTVGEGVFATPAAIDPPTTVALTAVAAAFADSIEARHGIEIEEAGQDWGNDEESQLRSLENLDEALSVLPESLVDEVRSTSGGTLTFLSNDHGRTIAGWQPYGNRAANFYTNEDRGPDGSSASHQVVLQPGSTTHTIAHEVIHAHQLLDTEPGDFVSALLTDEMESFMAATGWSQLASDEEIMATGGNSWTAINALFSYDGPALLYTNQFGSTSELYGPNPLEAYAEAAALYYTYDADSPLPDWTAYWSWFDANLG